jgi:hypothetical protein
MVPEYCLAPEVANDPLAGGRRAMGRQKHTRQWPAAKRPRGRGGRRHRGGPDGAPGGVSGAAGGPGNISASGISDMSKTASFPGHVPASG